MLRTQLTGATCWTHGKLIRSVSLIFYVISHALHICFSSQLRRPISVWNLLTACAFIKCVAFKILAVVFSRSLGCILWMASVISSFDSSRNLASSLTANVVGPFRHPSVASPFELLSLTAISLWRQTTQHLWCSSQKSRVYRVPLLWEWMPSECWLTANKLDSRSLILCETLALQPATGQAPQRYVTQVFITSVMWCCGEYVRDIFRPFVCDDERN